MIKTLVAVSLVVVSLTACQTNNRNIGAVIGGAAGGLLGATLGGGSGKLMTTGVGAVLGTVVGSSVGETMDKVK